MFARGERKQQIRERERERDEVNKEINKVSSYFLFDQRCPLPHCRVQQPWVGPLKQSSLSLSTTLAYPALFISLCSAWASRPLPSFIRVGRVENVEACMAQDRPAAAG